MHRVGLRSKNHMICEKCGSNQLVDAKFCSNCGAQLLAIEPEPIPSMVVERGKPSKFWLVFNGIVLLGLYASALLPAMAGNKVGSQASNWSVIWTAIFCSVLWRFRGRKARYGALVGLAVGFVILFLVGFIAALVRQRGAT